MSRDNPEMIHVTMIVEYPNGDETQTWVSGLPEETSPGAFAFEVMGMAHRVATQVAERFPR